jgi:RNA polymerase sigma factor (sigma-70 family)
MNPERDEFIPTRWSLIQRLKNLDDQESWRQFFDTYWKLILGVARKSGLSVEEAQDVVQETIMSVCKNIGEFRADPAHGKFKNWLLKLTRWRIADQFRKRLPEDKVRVHDRGHPAQEEVNSTATEERVPDPLGNELDALWEREWERNVVALALEKLERQVNAKHYQIFFLHVIKQYPAEQVAAVCGVEAGQVYVIKHRLSPVFRKAITEFENQLV